MGLLSEIEDVEFLENVNLSKFTTIKLGKVGSIAICRSETALMKAIEIITKENLKYHFVGWGSNQVLLNTIGTIFLKLDFENEQAEFNSQKELYSFTASTPLLKLTSMAMKFGLTGWEVFTGIPASFGGAIYMNAGTALGEIGDLITEVRVLKTSGEIVTYICNEDSFSYRKNNFIQPGEAILGGKIKHNGIDLSLKKTIKEYLEYRKKTQPLASKNCGSVFKNYDSQNNAGATLDRLGFKGYSLGDLRVSKKHANFIENTGNATSEQFKDLVERLGRAMEEQTGLKFELEVKIY